MSRIFTSASMLLAPLLAFAQESKPEAPVEKADPIVVILFLVLFVGSGVAYAGYLWWNRRKDRQGDD